MMLSTILLLTPTPLVPSLLLETTVTSVPGDSDIAAKIQEAGKSVDALWSLAETLEGDEAEADREKVYARIIELDSDHEGARKGLRHHAYDGHWYTTYAELSKVKRAEAKKMLEEHGLVRFEEDWVAPEEVPFRRMGWTQDERGSWVSASAAKRSEEEAKLLAEGWQQQNLTWIHPDDFDKWRDGLWKCGDEWLTLEDANAYHSKPETCWRFPGEYFVVNSTLDHDSLRWAGWYADQTYRDLVKVFGLKPDGKPELWVYSNVGEYNAFAAGDPTNGVAPAEIDGYSSLHYAFFAEAHFEPTESMREFKGMGVAFWDRTDPNLDPYGQHAVRHAAAQSYIEAIDPSWETVSVACANPNTNMASATFWGEKHTPRWLRYGAAAYAERFFRDENVQEGGNPWWARDWAIGNLKEGGIRPFDEIFAFNLSLNDIPGSGSMIQEAGLLVSFMLDGDSTEVRNAHQAFKAALRKGEGVDEAVHALERTLVENRNSLLEYASLQ